MKKTTRQRSDGGVQSCSEPRGGQMWLVWGQKGFLERPRQETEGWLQGRGAAGGGCSRCGEQHLQRPGGRTWHAWEL